ncbi:MAG: twin-arginine translocase TatA/TatE family subunit, partial [Phycisphaerales bacterium]|nr:twin-arginine translocase TatA/TatE family subunit [Phycisphaerales bacterium]
LLLFGGKKIPELSRGVARGLKVFKSEMNDVKKQFKEAADEADKEEETKTDDKA